MNNIHGFLLATLFYFGGCWGLEIRRLEVPRLAELHRALTLGCRYRLGSHRLQSVKWYKDGEEFFRFTPTERPGIRTFPVPGAQVLLENSDMHLVMLKNVSRVTAGVYTCEVTSEGPDFAIAKEEAKIDVYSLPDRYPEIQMDQTSIYSGRKLNAACSSGMSYPKQTLAWFLNGVQVNSSCITWEGTSGTGSGLIRSYSNVSVSTSGGPGPILLSCVATQDPLLPTYKDIVEISLLREPKHQRFMDSSKGSHQGLENTCYLDRFRHFLVITILFICIILPSL